MPTAAVAAAGRCRDVALIRAAGLIRRGDGPLGVEIAADELAGTLEDIADDPAFDAVLLRLDSGGGSAVASETIRRAVLEVRAAGKPVIVSMGNAAASGGYWIAMGADRIVAQPATLTGSIGVIAGKPVLEEAWRKLGVNWAEISRGANAGLWSINRPFSDAGPGAGRCAGRLALRPLHRACRAGARPAAGAVARDRARPRLGGPDAPPSSGWSTRSAGSTWRWPPCAAPCSCRPMPSWRWRRARSRQPAARLPALAAPLGDAG